MNEKVLQSKFLLTLKEGATKLLQLMTVWLIVQFGLSILELIYTGAFTSFSDKKLTLIGLSFWNDLLFWLKTWIYAFVIFVGLFCINPNLAKVVSIITLSLLSALQLSLIVYFCTTLVPLGSDLFGYSNKDILQTIGASSALNGLVIFSITVLIIAISVTLIWLPAKIKKGRKLALIMPAISLIVLISNIAKSSNYTLLNSEYENNIVLNKSDYFLSAIYTYLSHEKTELDIYADSYIGQYEGADTLTASFIFPDETRYPFYHTNQAPDVLSPFFKQIKNTPNIVILLVEGLGRAFSNEGAYLGNFTPFLDSLSDKSLYWKNFLSNGGRTFGVLPFLLGSMPLGDNGIWQIDTKLPHHLSLYNILKQNGYHTSFYYGGDAQFDNMELFLKRNGVDEINDLKSIPAGYTKLPAKGNGFSWGYADDQVYNYFLKNNEIAEIGKPKMSVVLTVATHDPFLIQNQSKYLNAFEERMNYLGFSDAKKTAYRTFKNQYATILYADEAIKIFFAEYEKRADYSNTIFIITGDHRMAEIPLRSKIDRFHVPLIIYSPLLKRTAQIESISTHFDIVPSLLAFLKQNTTLKLPATSSWLGDGLDTTRSFRNMHSYPLIQTKTSMIDFVQGEYHLNADQLFKLNQNLEETPVKNQNKFNQMMSSFNNFRNKNDRLKKGGKLLPDTILQQYQPH